MKNYFPIFKKLDNAKVLVFGGGNIAKRRVKTLLKFNLNIRVIAPLVCDELKKISSDRLEIVCETYDEKHIENCLFVLACTDNHEINHKIVLKCNELKIDVNNASNKEECDFYFPYIIDDEDVTVGITGDGSNHKKTKKISDELKVFLTERKF